MKTETFTLIIKYDEQENIDKIIKEMIKSVISNTVMVEVRESNE